MIKRLYTLLILLCSTAPLLAQSYSNRDDVFAPKKGQWQVSVVLGSGTFYDENTNYYLLPQYSNTGGAIGLPNEGDNSGNLGSYLNLGSLNYNSLVNIAGIQGKYFISDRWDVNVMFSMNVNITPKKDFVEEESMVDDLVIPSQKYINAQMTNNWMTTIGSNYYFKTANERINPYLGGAFGFQMARIETNQPYTGEQYDDEDGALPMQVYVASGKAGQMYGFKVAAVAGIEYTITKGLLLGFEFHPLAYRYDLIQLCPKGFDRYNAGHHNLKIFEMPVLKLGMRF